MAIFLLVGPSAFFIMKDRRVQEELDHARRDSLEWQRQYEAQQKKGNKLEQELQQARQNLEQRQQQTLPDDPGNENELDRPQSRVPVFALNIVRSANPNSSQPASQISIPRSASSVVLSLELESDPDVRSYRATISTADQRIVWSAKDLKPQSNDTLKVTLKSDLMKPGDYQLALEGLTKEGSYVSQGKYYFRVKESNQ
jgi:predicted  nucleic acid-binding Zn-ribbon protein